MTISTRGLNNRKFSTEEWNNITLLYKSGISTVALSRQFSVSRNTVLHHVRRLGIPVRVSAQIKKDMTTAAYISKDKKFCIDCKAPKFLSEFGLDNSRSDKLRNACKICDAVRVNKHISNRTADQIRRAVGRRAEWLKTNPSKSKKYAKDYYSSVKGRFVTARSLSTRKGKPWDLSFEFFCEITKRPCEYCGGALPLSGSGLDRLDNSKGYHKENVAPCCTVCNLTRRDQFTPNEMRLIIGPAINNLMKARVQATKDTN